MSQHSSIYLLNTEDNASRHPARFSVVDSGSVHGRRRDRCRSTVAPHRLYTRDRIPCDRPSLPPAPLFPPLPEDKIN